MAQYLHPDVIARAQALGVKARTIVEGLRVGDHRSPYRGFSVEFVQHREYVPGDDIRHIDWKSYGRSERYTIKQYEQETTFIGHVLLDGSRSIFDHAWRTQLPVSSQTSHILTILHTLEQTQPAAKTNIAPLLHDLAQQ